MVEAVAAQPGHERLDDAQGRRDGDGGVDGIPAGLERKQARLGGERVVGGNGAAPPHDDRSVRTRSFVGHETLPSCHGRLAAGSVAPSVALARPPPQANWIVLQVLGP